MRPDYLYFALRGLDSLRLIMQATLEHSRMTLLYQPRTCEIRSNTDYQGVVRWANLLVIINKLVAFRSEGGIRKYGHCRL